jgi:hypothetical protein
MKVAVIGSRTVSDAYYEDLCCHMPIGTSEIISGGADGADRLAERYASQMHLPCRIYVPNYKKYGKQATLIRNQQIIHAADYVIALWDGVSRGTGYTIKACLQEYIPVRVIDCSKK